MAILVKLSAQDVRILRGAKSPAELAGAVQLLRDRIDSAEALKALGKPVTIRARTYKWQEAWETAHSVLGDRLTRPPFPDGTWFRRINSTIRNWALDDEKVRAVAEHVRDHTRPGSTSFDWLICQHPRIMAGEYDVAKRAEPAQALVASCALPEE